MKLTKRIISLLMAMLMLFSGMAVTAFATGETTVKYTLNADNCTVDVEKVEIFVKAAKVAIEGTEYDVTFSATQADDATKSLRALKDTEGNTIFTDPVTGKNYNIRGTVKVGEDDVLVTNTVKVEVLNSKNAPSSPVAKKVTATSIEISTVSGCEYRIEKNGVWSAWQTSNVFSGLAENTDYKIEMRYAKTTTHYASPASSLTVGTLKISVGTAPDDIRLTDKTDKTLTVAAYKKVVAEDGTVTYAEVTNVQFSKDGGKTWQNTGAFTGLNADTTYQIVARYTHDASEEEANPATAPKEFITNKRESYPADLKKCTFKASDGDNYANENIEITVTADTSASQKYDAQYGDTRYIPDYYTVSGISDPFKFTTKDGKTYTSTFIPGEANANKTVDVKVYFVKEKCIGEEDGKAVWVKVSEPEIKTYKVKVGEVHTTMTDIRNFFLGIFDALFNTIPAKINEMLKGFDLAGALDGLTGLLEGLGGLDLGALTGTTNK